MALGKSDPFVNYLPVLNKSQENLCIAHRTTALQPAYRG
jgi:hypothetical protein